jgi:membrane protein
MMATRSERNGQRGRAPDSPNKLPKSAWRSALKRTISEFSADNLTDYAAALTYYGIVALFPALIALVSILGLVGQSATKPLLDNLGGFAPGPAHQILQNALDGLTQSRGGAGILLVVGLGGALWSASGYIGAFIRASNIIWDVEEGRPIWRTLPLRLVITVTMIVLLAISAIAVVVTGPLADRVGKLLGVGSTFVTVWDVAKWPVLVVVVSFMFSILYYASPNVRQPGFRWVTPGGVLAVISWIVVSAAFGIYVANFGSYNKTYGSLGAIIIFLVWLWLSNVAILLGAELNAELERGRQLEAGEPAEDEILVTPRAEKKGG